MKSDLICLGAIAGSFGVKGEVRLKSFCADPASIGDYGPLITEDGTRSFTVKVTRPVAGGFAARLGGIASKEQADAMRGTRLYAPRDALPALPDDEFYHADLIGLEVVDTGGAALGHVRAVMNHGSGDLLELFQPGRSSTILLPFTREAVPTVDLAQGRIVADPPEGLL
ncbi:ribosome maturation factor RimM [Brevirhabdus sp.]|uniref:ribosome maturation factor RimM n=1 Tax=Brevirhabdus sp. TaxID=2004514 RepID=UPI0040585E5E